MKIVRGQCLVVCTFCSQCLAQVSLHRLVQILYLAHFKMLKCFPLRYIKIPKTMSTFSIWKFDGFPHFIKRKNCPHCFSREKKSRFLSVIASIKNHFKSHLENGFGVRYSMRFDVACKKKQFLTFISLVCGKKREKGSEQCFFVYVCVCVHLVAIIRVFFALFFPFSRSSFYEFDIQTSCSYFAGNNTNSTFHVFLSILLMERLIFAT